jgi:hypothetical protein
MPMALADATPAPILKKIITPQPTYAPVPDGYYTGIVNNTIGDDQDMNSFDGAALLTNLTGPYYEYLGPFAFLIIFGTIGAILYLKTNNMALPITMFLFGSALIGPMLLPEYTAFIWGLVVIGLAGMMFSLWRTRG